MGVTLRVDPHVHSVASYDGRAPVEAILQQARDVDLDAVVVTDHDGIEASLRAAELAPAYGLVGVPGVEVSTAAGHLLAVGIDRCPEPRRPLAETVDFVRDHGGAAIVPHPFQRTRHGVRKRRISDCDAIEVYNAWLFTGYRNRRAERFAAKNAIPGVGGSDAHSVRTVGRAYTVLDVDVPDVREATSADVVEAIRRGGTAVEGRRAPIHRSAGHYALGATRRTVQTVSATVSSFI